LKNWGLYVILDRELAGERDLIQLACDIAEGGADVIQLRDKTSNSLTYFKNAEVVREVTRHLGAQFIINDRVDIAKSVAADGIHLGQDDLPISETRAILGKYGIIGKSCHSLEQAIKAQEEGADYIGLGPIFKTSTKPYLNAIGVSLIKEVKKSITIPFVCIGGINSSNIEEVISAGAKAVAVASAIVCADNAIKTTKEIKGCLNDAVRIC